MSALPSPAMPTTGRHRPWWPWLRRALGAAFVLGVLALLAAQARRLPWTDVGAALQALPLPLLLVAAMLAAASHALVSCFDLFGRAATGHRLGTRQVMAVNFVSYAFNLNFGSLVGGVAFRYRLYARLGLDGRCVTRVLAISMFTNWLGYLAVAGGLFLLQPPTLPPDWPIGGAPLRALGALLLLLPLLYLGLCAFATRREWGWRGRVIRLPGWRFGGVQLLVSATNWLLMGGVLYTLLHPLGVDYADTLAALLLGAVAGVITHVPAGLGVLEAVFVALFDGRAPTVGVLAAVLAYRALYYLLPLAVASLMYLHAEARGRRH